MTPPLVNSLDQHIIVHTHIEKCGGSTLLHYLTTLVGKENSLDLRPFLGKKRLKGYSEIQKKKRCLKLLSGHFPYDSLWTKLIPNNRWTSRFIPPLFSSSCRKKALYVASVRHPIERLDSLFRYLKTRPRHYLYNQHIINNDFDGFIQSLVAMDNHLVNNGICAQLAGCAPGTNLLEKAKNAVDHAYLAVVPYNKTHELANTLADAWNQSPVKEKMLNKSEPSEKTIPSKETLFILEQKCSEDIELYHYVINKYPEKLIAAKNKLKQLIPK